VHVTTAAGQLRLWLPGSGVRTCARAARRRTCIGQVDLVAQHEERHAGQAVVRQQAHELPLALREALAVGCIHQVHNGVYLRGAGHARGARHAQRVQ
jgi:hypothetical protein